MALTRPRMPRGAVVAVCLAIAALVAAMFGGRPGQDGPPLDPRSDGPLGTSALVSLLGGVGASVDLSVGLPTSADDVALVLQDRLQPTQADELMRWVDQGGTLVVTDPSSALTPPVVEAAFGLDLGSDQISPERCSIDALRDLGDVEVGAAVRFVVPPGGASCFENDDGGAFVVAVDEGLGQVVAVGGAAFVTNELLGRDDNAVLAATLLAPSVGTAVRFVDPPVPAGGGDKTLGDLVPSSVKRALLQLGIAFALYALWRAIRLGQPVPEEPPVAVAGSGLVRAVGRLLSRTNAPGPVAELLRAPLRRVLRTRLGVPAGAPIETLAEVTAARTGVAIEQVRRAIDDTPVTTVAELIAVARAAASIHQEVPQ